ncbi:MAG: cell surface protein SprA [Spirosomataceae bacterium]|jgi:cell surface protein SprA
MPKNYLKYTFLLLLSLCGTLSTFGQVSLDSLTSKFNTLKVEAPARFLDTPTLAFPDSVSKSGTRPVFRWQEGYLSRFGTPYYSSPFYTITPSKVKTSIQYQPQKGAFDISQRISDSLNYRAPQTLTFDEYSSIQNAAIRKSIMRDYEKLADGNSTVSGRGLNPSINKNPVLDRIFGGKIPEFTPNGFISVDLRIGQQFINNPFLPIFQRRSPIFDLDPQININFNSLFSGGQGGNGVPGRGSSGRGNLPNQLPGLDQLDRFGNIKNLAGALDKFGNIKDKLGVVGNFDTKSAFGTENQFKINYRNEPENILQSIELGNVSMPVRSQLIPGVQNLQGGKVGLRFGKLYVTSVFANQQSRTESIIINGGNQTRPFEIRSDNYDENRHFFLGQYFRNNYEKALRNLPMVLSGVRITRVEVYVTNRTNTVESMRNLVGIADLGEPKPFNESFIGKAGQPADNNVNDIYSKLANNESFRTIDNTNSELVDLGLKKGVGFELLRGAKRLTDREFILQPELGYISLFTPLRNDEILAVAYEYTLNGRKYQVGELAEDYSIRPADEVITMKMLKSSTIRNNLNNPMWDLMMKNVYSMGQGQIERDGFQLRIIYKDDRTGIDNPNLQEGAQLKNRPLIEVMKLDKLNYNLDPQPDGNFDYIEGITVNEQYGKIIFPVLEPFGSFLESKFTASEQLLKEKYVFNELYEQTLIDAQQINTKNKFFITGSVRLSSREIPLPLGASGQSVRVYAGGVELQQGVDYTVDNQLGRIRLTNESILNSARQIRIDYERPDLFQAQFRRLFGLRLDYTVGRFLRLGATLMDMRETTPGFLTRAAIGNEPVNNTIWGLDLNLKTNWYGLTRALDKIPFLETKETSAIQLTAEFAQLRPGVNNKRVSGNAMIDDFETARNINDLTRQPTRWRLGATPEKFDERGQFGELGYNYRRAKMSVYTLDPSAFFTGGFGTNSGTISTQITGDAANNLYERAFNIQDIFPGRSRPALGQQLPTAILDVSYFPEEKGMYNYNPELSAEGLLSNPKKNFGSATRGLTFDADFDNANVEYLEFWMLDPFKDQVRDGVKNLQNTTGGKLIFHLGDISEDVIPDSRFNFENGLRPDSTSGTEPIATVWGKAPRSQYVTDAFANSETSRANQDVGLEGLSNAEETNFYATYLNTIRGKVTNPLILNEILADPSGDDFRFYLDSSFPQGVSFLQRFKNYLGMENNAPVTQGTELLQGNSFTADKEDVNDDNTINDVENYYEYEIDLQPDRLEVGNGFIIDKVTSPGAENATWYLFRVPLRQFTGKTGDINGFKSVRFMRMLMTNWEQPVVCRFGTLQLVSNLYRIYPYELSNVGLAEIPEPYDAKFKVATVSIEENGCDEQGNCNVKEGRTPYVVPPGFVRDRDFTQIGNVFQFNEQSISLGVENLRDGDARAVFKNTKLDLNMYKRLQMYIHAETPKEVPFQDNYGVGAFIRIGTDTRDNYYEIELSDLQITVNQEGLQDATQIWPLENEVDFPIDELRNLKIARNLAGAGFTERFTKEVLIDGTAFGANGDERSIGVTRSYKISVVGNPDLSNVLTVMLGMTNPLSDDQQPKSFTVWMNELRANGFDQTPGEAGILSADIKLADIGTILLNGNFSTFGFGGVQDRISMRTRDNAYSFGVATSLDLDRFTPQKWGLSIPFFVSYDWQQVTPYFDPLDPDIRLRDLVNLKNQGLLDNFNKNGITDLNEYMDLIVDRSVNRGFNFTNVRKTRTDLSKKTHFYDLENFAATFAKNRSNRSNVLISDYTSEQARGGLSYLYQPKPFVWEPFKATEFKEGRFSWIKDFNFAPKPSVVAVRSEYDRSFISTQYRNDRLTTAAIAPNIQKYFLGNRTYDLQWNLSRSLLLNYNAVMNTIIDEPFGDIDTEAERDSLRGSIFSLGRPKEYRQSMDFTWRLPTDKIYLLDWVQADAKYNNQFGYRANSFGIRETFDDGTEGDLFGNYAENGREIGIRGRVDLVKLYNKIKFLKFANSPKAPRSNFTRAFGDEEILESGGSDLARTLTRLLMTIRGINFNYSNIRTTVLPGFLPSPRYFGLSNEFRFEDALPFVLGSQRYKVDPTQPGGWLYEADANGWLSKNTQRNDPFIQSRQKRFDYNVNLEPFKGLRMQIKGNYAKGDDYQILYRPQTQGGDFEILSPIRNGNMSISFWSFNTLPKRLKRNDDWQQNDIFDLFRSYRTHVSDYFNTNLANGQENQFDVSSQDVLITAFIAAYSGKGLYQSDSSEQVNILNKYLDKNIKPFETTDGRRATFNNLFRSLPFPNWRIDFAGVEKIPLFNTIFSSITLSHSYTSTYNIGNFTSSLDYGNNTLDNYTDLLYLNLLANDYTYGFRIGDVLNTALYTPLFVMSTVSIEEKFGPVIGANFRLKNGMTGRLDWNLERRSGLNLGNLQVAEYNRNDIVASIGFRKNNVRIPIRGRDGNQIVLKNDLNFNFNLTVSDLKMIQRPLEGDAIAIQGNYNVQIRPQIQYQFNKKFSGSFYIERLVNNAFTSLSFDRRSTIGGINVRFNLAD